MKLNYTAEELEEVLYDVITGLRAEEGVYPSYYTCIGESPILLAYEQIAQAERDADHD